MVKNKSSMLFNKNVHEKRSENSSPTLDKRHHRTNSKNQDQVIKMINQTDLYDISRLEKTKVTNVDFSQASPEV